MDSSDKARALLDLPQAGLVYAKRRRRRGVLHENRIAYADAKRWMDAPAGRKTEIHKACEAG